MKGLAGEGRTVFVSSHLLSEMALTADHVVVIGKGRLLAQLPTADLIARSSQNFVKVRSPEVAALKAALDHGGAATVLETQVHRRYILALTCLYAVGQDTPPVQAAARGRAAYGPDTRVPGLAVFMPARRRHGPDGTCRSPGAAADSCVRGQPQPPRCRR
jgi:hypothetical protein